MSLLGAKSYINCLKTFEFFLIHLVFTWTSKECNILKTLNKASVGTLCKFINFLMQHTHTDAIYTKETVLKLQLDER